LAENAQCRVLSSYDTAGQIFTNAEEREMTPQERELIADLFDRLARLESQPHDPEAERAIRDGSRLAPHAIYPLVQTVLVQDEALKAANAHIEGLESSATDAASARPTGFLDNMRDVLFGRTEPGRGSVPPVRPGSQLPPRPNAPQTPFGQPYAQGAFAQPSQGPSFLGTAAATAAGLVGGSLLLDGVRSALGGHQGGPFAKAIGELNAGPRIDDGSHEATSTGYDQAGDAYDTGDTDFADVGGFDDGSGGGLDSA
jgi:hypothetical protein